MDRSFENPSPDLIVLSRTEMEEEEYQSKKSSRFSRLVNGWVADISSKPTHSKHYCQPKPFCDFGLLILGCRFLSGRQCGNPAYVSFFVYCITGLPVIQLNQSDLRKS
jgi:hypothetical protein